MYLPGIYIPIYQYIETLHNFVQYTIISPQLLCSRSYLPLGTDTLSSFDLQREARRHFGCSTLNGLELENLGGPATRYLHWKKRIIEVSTTYMHCRHVNTYPASAYVLIKNLLVSLSSNACNTMLG